MRSSKVIETKVSSRNAFISNHFALESEKESEKNNQNFFEDCLQILDLPVNPYNPNATYMWFSGLF